MTALVEHAGISPREGAPPGFRRSPPLCTCVGCPATTSRLVVHAWQDALWLAEKRWKPCPGCDMCQCPIRADGEDLLCLWCRSHGGESRASERFAEAVTAYLRAAETDGSWRLFGS